MVENSSYKIVEVVANLIMVLVNEWAKKSKLRLHQNAGVLLRKEKWTGQTMYENNKIPGSADRKKVSSAVRRSTLSHQGP